MISVLCYVSHESAWWKQTVFIDNLYEIFMRVQTRCVGNKVKTHEYSLLSVLKTSFCIVYKSRLFMKVRYVNLPERISYM